MKNGKLLFALLLSILSFSAFAQEAKTDSLPAYKKYKNLPAFKLLAMDSATVFNTYYIPAGKITVLMMFSPDCDHCHKQIEKILSKMDSLKNVQFYLVTPMSIAMTKEFAAKLKLSAYKNIHVYKDYQYFYPMFYSASTVPIFAVYDKKKKFVELWDGNVKIKNLIELQAE